MTTRIVAAHCFYCGKPVEYEPDAPLNRLVTHELSPPKHDGYTTLLNGDVVHVACVNRNTKDRAFPEEEAERSSRPA